MQRKLALLLPIVVLLGGWQFLQKFQILGLDALGLKPRAEQAAVAPGALQALPPARSGDVLRIASFNIQVFGEAKLSDPKVAACLAQIVRKFDVVAIQEVRAKDANLVNRFVQQVSAAGVPYDCVVGPRLGRSDSKEQYAYIFDATRVEVDRVSVYTVKDPDDLLHREPLVAGFRARGVPPNEAFTFTLIDIHTDPDETDRELNVLDDVFRAVREDGRGEDDIILLGDLNVDEAHLGQLGALPYLSYVISGVPTNTRGTKTYDNILFDRRATTEFLGRGGVLDLVREFNITLDQALLISDHCPIWAEFSVYEGGRAGNIAARPK
jgi:deoxyribonuclease-1-like protein